MFYFTCDRCLSGRRLGVHVAVVDTVLKVSDCTDTAARPGLLLMLLMLQR